MLYNISNEANASTSMQDVFNDDINNGDHDNLKHIYTAPEIDIQAGTYRSKGTLETRLLILTRECSRIILTHS